eukprot:Lankesteria_metandrocarpae@DN1442_c0_g1_i1.p1
MVLNETARPVWGHLEYTWRLEKLWELRALASIEALEEDGGDVVWSSRFGDEDHGVWRLKLYPYGDSSPSGKGHLSLFLSLDIKSMHNPRAYAIFGCYVLDSKGDKMADCGRSFTRQRFNEHSSSWGWSQFIKIEGNSFSKILIDESLTLKCQVEVFLGLKSNCSVDLPKSVSLPDELCHYLATPENQNVRLVWQPAEENISHNSPEEAFVAECSAVLLAARSTRFREMLRSPAALKIASVGGPQDFTSLNGKKYTDNRYNPTASPRSVTAAYTSFGTPMISSLTASQKATSSTVSSASPNGILHGTTLSGTAPTGIPDGRISNTGTHLVSLSRQPASKFDDSTGAKRSGIPVAVEADSCRKNSITGDVTQSEVMTIIVDDISRAAVQNLYEYLTTDKCPLLTQLNADLPKMCDLLAAAAKYGVDSLKWKLVPMLIGRLTNEVDCRCILETGKLVKIDILESEASRYLYSVASGVAKNELWSGAPGLKQH